MLLKDRFNKIPFRENNNKKSVWKEEDPTKLRIELSNEFVFATITQSQQFFIVSPVFFSFS